MLAVHINNAAAAKRLRQEAEWGVRQRDLINSIPEGRKFQTDPNRHKDPNYVAKKKALLIQAVKVTNNRRNRAKHIALVLHGLKCKSEVCSYPVRLRYPSALVVLVSHLNHYGVLT